MLSVNETIRSLNSKYQIDIISSDEGLICYIDPTEIYEITENTTKQAVKDFAFSGETVGFLSYDFGMLLRGVVINKKSDFPLGLLKKYRYKLIFGDSVTGDTDLLDALPACNSPLRYSKHNIIRSSATQADYINGCKRTLSEIRNGNTYQLNYAIKHEFHDPEFDSFDEFLRLREVSPAKFAAFINAGSHKILSLSPERFLKCTNGQILSQPIKGTFKTDKKGLEDSHKLTKSSKECAELSMIVDMIRNDISINSEYGSVKVENHKSVFRVNNLLQMYADVHGKLKNSSDVIDLLFDAFPGGSITGCPKRRSMEIIDSLEPFSREIYCGAIFRINDKHNIDSSICIRTGTYNTLNNLFSFYAGSGIVIDSVPSAEYQETMSKAEKFWEVYG
jgi:para-aminobenzoate synthetase component 1